MTRARPLLLVAAAAAIVAMLGWLLLLHGGSDDDGPQATLATFARAWSSGDDAGAAQATDDPAVARRELTASRQGLDGAAVRADVESVDVAGASARARLALRWTVPGFGAWSYRSRVQLRRDNGTWTVHWRPTVIHPGLDDATRLGTRTAGGDRGAILDRDGRALIRARP